MTLTQQIVYVFIKFNTLEFFVCKLRFAPITSFPLLYHFLSPYSLISIPADTQADPWKLLMILLSSDYKNEYMVGTWN